MAEPASDPRRILLPRGQALQLLIRVELDRREGARPGGEDDRLAAMIVGFLDEREPPLDIGIDCNGDGVPDFKDSRAALEAVASGKCDCRAEVLVEETRVVQTEPARAVPAAATTEKAAPKGGSRGW